MSSLRITVLEMLAEGRLTVDDAERLLSTSIKAVMPRRRAAARRRKDGNPPPFRPPVLPTCFSGADIQIM